MFRLNQALIDRAREILQPREDLHWIIGGSCTGKTTVSRIVAQATGITLYDMDAHIFGEYMGLYDPQRHPASTAWFSAKKPFDWAFSLPQGEFDSLNRAANAEYLDLLAGEIADLDRSLLVDGGITHPTVLAQAVPARRIVCLEISEDLRRRTWENGTEKATMKEWVYELPDPEKAWQRFLDLDRAISQKIVSESRQMGIKVIFREEDMAVPDLASEIATYLEL